MTTHKEALKLALDGAANYIDTLGGDSQKYRQVLAQPEQETVAWKLVPTEPTDEMLKAMDECSTEGYDERLYAGHAASVYMAAVDVAPTPPKPEQEPVVWMYQDKSTHQVSFQKHMKAFVDHSKTSEVPLYGKPLANHELQCVCGAVWCGDEMVHLPNKTPPQPKQDKERCVGCEACIDTACGRDECPKGWPKAAQLEQEPVAWEGGEVWELLAWELCADENGEEACNDLIWEGGPIPEPWGDRWMKYEGEAKRLIALVQKHTTQPQRTWVGLTDEQKHQLNQSLNLQGRFPIIDAIEAICKGNNT